MPLKLDEVILRTFPRDKSLLGSSDFVVRSLIVGDMAPPEPPLAPADAIACIGSCFAQELAKSLAAKGRSVLPIFISERWNTTFALHHFLALAMDGTPMPAGFIPSGVDTGEVMASAGDIRKADAFILTFGLSACWFEKATGQMVLDIPQGHSAKGLIKGFDTHEMRQTTVEENVEQMSGAIACIRRHKPDAPIVLTLSPIPLLVSFTANPAVTANHISKAVLRAALHTICEQWLENVTYWPSYDIVEYMAQYHGPIFGQGDDDLRHIKQPLINSITALFDELYFKKP